MAEIHGFEKAERVTEHFALLEAKIMTVIERVDNHMLRAVDQLPSGCKEAGAKPLIGRAMQVKNIDKMVLNICKE
ncbi:hypothetical protein [Pararhizobium sp. IMCC21322]|uniref:hypothetical protein n=1 Tax=Pararhizobium sp. IMCC21322 TaxID=3067903 RepID=UPI002740E44E|nr:hypothetical protein [Pararhizobium sp. IMCC21322]